MIMNIITDDGYSRNVCRGALYLFLFVCLFDKSFLWGGAHYIRYLRTFLLQSAGELLVLDDITQYSVIRHSHGL